MLIEHLTVQQHPLPVASNEMASGTAAESVQSEPVVALPATRSLIKTGDLILACDPWVWCLQWERYDTTCAYCGSEPQKLFKCAGCKLHRYCGEKCQVADWKTEHKRECCALKVVAHQIREVLRSHTCDSCHKLILTDGPLISGSASAILMAKIMTKVKLNGVDELPGLEGKSPLEIFESFPKHPKLAVLSDVFREMCPAFIQLVAQFVPPLFPNVYECLGMLHNNNFHIHGQGPREFLFGNALFPHVPLQNMKAVCWNSNVIPYFRGRRLYLWATADIPDYTGLQDLTYTDQMIRYFQYTAAQRREVFARTNGNRTCNCGKCTATFEADINPLKCITVGCSGRIPADSRALKPCAHCGVINSEHLSKFCDFMHKYDLIWKNAPDGNDADAAKFQLLRTIDTAGILHGDAHMLFVCGFQQVVKNGQAEKDWKFVHDLVPCVRAIFPRYHIWRAHCLTNAAVYSANGLHAIFRVNVGLRSAILPLILDAYSWSEEAVDIYGKLCGEDALLTRMAVGQKGIIKDKLDNIRKCECGGLIPE